MKNIIILLICLSLQACHTISSADQKPYQVSEKSIEKTIRYLASDELQGRETGSEGIEKAARYIEDEFRRHHVKPFYKTYRDSFSARGLEGYNLIAFKEGTDPVLKDDIIVLGAHYDHIGMTATPVQGDSIANGANDNASGTAAVVELAKYFAGTSLKRSLLFVLFSGEEKGLVGSAHLAERLKEEGKQVYYMLNYEMIGTPIPDVTYTAYMTGYNVSNLADRLNDFSGDSWIGNWTDSDKFQLFKRSDNYAFYRHLNVPAHTLSSFNFSNFDHYHKVGDEADLIDFSFIKDLVIKSIPAIEKSADTPNLLVQLRFN